MDFARFGWLRYAMVVTGICLLHHAAGAVDIAGFLHKSYRERSVFFLARLMPELQRLPPPGQVRLIDDWIAQARTAHDRDAVLELRIARLNAMEDARQISVDQKIAALNAELRALDPKRSPEYTVRLMTDLGNNYYGKKRNYTLAFENYINAYTLSKSLSSTDFPEKKNIVVCIGNRYYSIGDLDKARRILEEADTMNGDWMRVDNYNAKNTLGLICRANRNYDMAIRLFNTAYTMAQQDSSMLWAAIARGNIGICHYLQGNYAQAIPLLEQDVAYSLASDSRAEDNGVNSLLILGDIHFRQGWLARVAEDLRQARNCLPRCRDRIRPLSQIYALEARYFAQRGDFREAYAAQDSATAYKDSLIARDNILKVARVEHRKDQENHLAQLSRLNAERKLAVVSRNSLLAGISLLAVIMLMGISRQRLRARARHTQLLIEREQAEQRLRNATDQLSSFTRHLQEKNALIERSADEILKLQAALADTRHAEVKNEVLQQLYTSTILTDAEWTQFKLLFEQVHKGYLQHLKEKLPELTPADTRFLVLSKLALSGKEMSAILGVAPDTIRSYRHRLRKRFEQSEDPEIRALINGIQ